jgi:DDE superfamily endonuclease
MLMVLRKCVLNGELQLQPLVHSNALFRGIKLLYLPPYSPDFNPIEECFSYMKTVIRRHGDAFRAVIESKHQEAITAFLTDTLETVTAQHARGWFRDSNYV